MHLLQQTHTKTYNSSIGCLWAHALYWPHHFFVAIRAARANKEAGGQIAEFTGTMSWVGRFFVRESQFGEHWVGVGWLEPPVAWKRQKISSPSIFVRNSSIFAQQLIDKAWALEGFLRAKNNCKKIWGIFVRIFSKKISFEFCACLIFLGIFF